MPDGSPQLTLTWVDTDRKHVIITSVQTHLKVRNIERDLRVAVAIADPENAMRYFQIRGRVIDLTTEGGAEHIEQVSRKYTGGSYAWYGGRDQVRVKITTEPEKIGGMGVTAGDNLRSRPPEHADWVAGQM